MLNYHIYSVKKSCIGPIPGEFYLPFDSRYGVYTQKMLLEVMVHTESKSDTNCIFSGISSSFSYVGTGSI